MEELNTIYDNGDGFVIKSAGLPYVDTRIVYTADNSVQVNGVSAPVSIGGDYMADVGDAVTITATLTGEGVIDYGDAVLKVPVTRHADNEPTDDEVYFKATIKNNVMVATGSFTRSGDWQLTAERLNSALERIGADWKVADKPLSIIV